jgi:hypothetical protein
VTGVEHHEVGADTTGEPVKSRDKGSRDLHLSDTGRARHGDPEEIKERLAGRTVGPARSNRVPDVGVLAEPEARPFGRVEPWNRGIPQLERSVGGEDEVGFVVLLIGKVERVALKVVELNRFAVEAVAVA